MTPKAVHLTNAVAELTRWEAVTRAQLEKRGCTSEDLAPLLGGLREELAAIPEVITTDIDEAERRTGIALERIASISRTLAEMHALADDLSTQMAEAYAAAQPN